MFNANIEQLLDYWRGRCAGRLTPRRADIGPAGFAPLAPQVFVARATPSGDLFFRLAGEWVSALHGRPLGGESVLRLWRPDQRGRLSRLLATSLAGADPLVLAARTDTGGDFEILFAPLAGPDEARDSFLGLYQTLSRPAVMPIALLAIEAVNGLAESDRRAHLRLAALHGRRIA
jgi:hypothetical protein